ncbi:Hypothetical predicted protein [Podarcis lilfordi]|uniref:Uncharacterized protein n=1 Tax=Podarcis lilfordi TaxID=74358 RepID=A0AA35JTI0_9SAUR|nr:Hypothetical predicted protein [Podarcis lilfordi]
MGKCLPTQFSPACHEEQQNVHFSPQSWFLSPEFSLLPPTFSQNLPSVTLVISLVCVESGGRIKATGEGGVMRSPPAGTLGWLSCHMSVPHAHLAMSSRSPFS